MYITFHGSFFEYSVYRENIIILAYIRHSFGNYHPKEILEIKPVGFHDFLSGNNNTKRKSTNKRELKKEEAFHEALIVTKPYLTIPGQNLLYPSLELPSGHMKDHQGSKFSLLSAISNSERSDVNDASIDSSGILQFDDDNDNVFSKRITFTSV